MEQKTQNQFGNAFDCESANVGNPSEKIADIRRSTGKNLILCVMRTIGKQKLTTTKKQLRQKKYHKSIELFEMFVRA